MESLIVVLVKFRPLLFVVNIPDIPALENISSYDLVVDCHCVSLFLFEGVDRRNGDVAIGDKIPPTA